MKTAYIPSSGQLPTMPGIPILEKFASREVGKKYIQIRILPKG
jgi:hypothetical protein